MKKYEVSPMFFNSQANYWEQYNDKVKHSKKRLRLLTFNVWFSEYYWTQRYQKIIEIVEHHKPDFVAFQEVLPNFLAMLLETTFIKENYYISTIEGHAVEPYGILILSRFAPQKFSSYSLPTMMARKLLVAEFIINEQDFQIATVHLESLKESLHFRRSQLQKIFPILNRSQHAVLVGDFNFCSSWAENHNIDSSYLDLWPQLHRDRPGYTEDTSVNLMRWAAKRKHKHVRFDRILLRSQAWTAKSIQLIGTEPIRPELFEVFPSDHFGLVADITLSDA